MPDSDSGRPWLLWQLDSTWSLLQLLLDGLTDEEAMWLPAPEALRVELTPTGWVAGWPESEEPGPTTSIAWVMWHIGWWWVEAHEQLSGSGPVGRDDAPWPGDVTSAIASLDRRYRDWRQALSDMTDEELQSVARTASFGQVLAPLAGRPVASVAAWVNQELMKNTAELGVLRRLYAARQGAEAPVSRVNPVLQQELLLMAEVDQELAGRCLEASQADPALSGLFVFQTPRHLWPQVYVDAEASCARHAERLLTIVDRVGWPGRSLVGEAAAAGAWLLAQHAPAEDQRELLPFLRRAVAAGEADAEHLAMVTDRLAMHEGRPQPYGTHLRMTPDGEREPIGEPGDAARRDLDRAELGLDSWRDYITRIAPPTEP